MPATTEIDTENKFDWAERTTNEYSLFGREYKDVNTIFDDGHTEAESYLNGVLTRFSLTDPTDALAIESQVVTYAVTGEITSSNTLDDDGQRSELFYENNVLAGEVKTDESNARPWSTIDITYEDGVVDSIDIDYETQQDFVEDANFLLEISYDADNTADWMFIVEGRSGLNKTVTTIDDTGGQTVESYRSDIITRSTQEDFGDSEEWREILTLFDDGVIETRFTFNDDGTNFIETFEEGDLVRTRLQDDAQAHPYYGIDTYYDADGNITSRVTDNDPGPTITETFDAGVLLSLKETTGAGSIETFFDADGTATRRETRDSDGNVVTEVLRETTVRVDTENTARWSEITTITDGNGVLIERETDYDNGNVRLDSFTDGVLSTRLNTDADGDTTLISYENGQRTSMFKEDISGSKNWTTQAFEYDANGQLSDKLITYDNGSLTEFIYEDGVLYGTFRSDEDNAFSWDFVLSLYEDGELTARETTFDNGDATIFVYEDGARDARLRIDGDDSNDWALQLTVFDEGGNVTTTYDSANELPEAYSYLFAPDAYAGY